MACALAICKYYHLHALHFRLRTAKYNKEQQNHRNAAGCGSRQISNNKCDYQTDQISQTQVIRKALLRYPASWQQICETDKANGQTSFFTQSSYTNGSYLLPFNGSVLNKHHPRLSFQFQNIWSENASAWWNLSNPQVWLWKAVSAVGGGQIKRELVLDTICVTVFLPEWNSVCTQLAVEEEVLQLKATTPIVSNGICIDRDKLFQWRRTQGNPFQCCPHLLIVQRRSSLLKETPRFLWH